MNTQIVILHHFMPLSHLRFIYNFMVYFFFYKIYYFLEHFQVHSKMEGKAQRFPYTPHPHSCTAFPIISGPSKVEHLFQLMNLHGHIITTFSS